LVLKKHFFCQLFSIYQYITRVYFQLSNKRSTSSNFYLTTIYLQLLLLLPVLKKILDNLMLQVYITAEVEENVYWVRRTKNHMMPVYLKTRKDTQLITVIQKIDGDMFVSINTRTSSESVMDL